MARQTRVGTHCTTVSHNPLRVTYHSTVIVEQTLTGIRLDSGGWRTSTTKTRINQAANEYGLGFQVYQHKGKWFVRGMADGGTAEFVDGMVI